MNTNEAVDKDPSASELDATQNIRKELLDLLLADKKALVEDLERMAMVDKLLSSQDRATLGRMRLKVEEKTSKSNAQIVAMMAALALDPQIKTIGLSITPVDRQAPELPEGIVEFEILPGEMDQGTVVEDFDTFMTRAKSQRLLKS